MADGDYMASNVTEVFEPIEGAVMTREDMFELLKGATGSGGRNQLAKPAKREMASQLGVITQLPPAVFDFRTLNSNQQTSRARSESLGARQTAQSEAGKTFEDWVFVGRITAPVDEHQSIVKAMKRMLASVSTIGVLVSDKPSWSVLSIFYHPDREAQAELLADYFGFDRSHLKQYTEAPPLANAGDVQYTPADPDCFLDITELQSILEDWRRKKNLILQGPPGVGKTFIIRNLVDQLMGGFDAKRFQMVQFHQSSAYEDFIRGWRPVDGKDGFHVVDGSFLKFCENARADKERPYVLAIDEINRANLSRVFGELLLLLDHDKRSANYAVQLAQKSPDPTQGSFFVPPNVYVIATMNTADRSLAVLDMAMRRRFAFRDLRPAFGNAKFDDAMSTAGVDNNVRNLVHLRFSALNRIIARDTKALGPGFEIGHSFFCPTEQVVSSENWYRAIINSEIAPLLKEYWFDNAPLAVRYIKALEETDLTAKTAIELDDQKKMQQLPHAEADDEPAAS